MAYVVIPRCPQSAFGAPYKASAGVVHLLRRRSHVRFLLVVITMLILHPFSGSARPGKNSSRWVDTAIVIDGNNDEWPKPYPYRDELDARMQFSIANDAQTLFLTLKTSDETTKTKLLKNGLTVFVDTSGHKLLNLSFGFSVVEAQKERHRGEHGSAADAPEDERLDITGVQVIGSKKYDGTYKLDGNKPGIQAAAAMNDYNELVWEIAIPFKCIYTDVGGHVSSKEHLSICFTFFGLSANDIFELNRAVEQQIRNAMPVMKVDSNALAAGQDGSARPGKSSRPDKADPGGSDDGEGGNPVRNADGSMGVGIGGGGGKGKGGGKSGGSDAQVVDAVTAMQNRQRAQQDTQVWKEIKLSYDE